MATYYGGQATNDGFRLNRPARALKSRRDNGAVRGDMSTRRARPVRLVVVAVGPLLGLAYVILFPVLFLGAIVYSLARMAVQGA